MAGIVNKIKERLEKRYSIRLHMTLILFAVTLCGALFGKILYETGVASMPLRYCITVALAYVVFLVFVRMWLWYVAPKDGSTSSNSSSNLGVDSLDIGDLGNGSVEGGKAAGQIGSGGSFSGAGATGNWGVPLARAEAAGMSTTSTSNSSSTSTSGGFSLDVDDARGVLLIAAVAIVAAVVAGAWVYLIYEAPIILSEAFFQALLATGLYRKTRQMHETGWAGSVIRATIIPFTVVLATAVALGFAVEFLCPQASKLAEAFRACAI